MELKTLAHDKILTKARLFLPEGTTKELEFVLPREPSYEELDKIIRPLLNGADLEHVSVLAQYVPNGGFRARDMFVDEVGRIKGLPRNEAATKIYRNATMMGHTGMPIPDSPEELDYIVGPAVLFERKVWF